jgi:hypothetical protein
MTQLGQIANAILESCQRTVLKEELAVGIPQIGLRR